MNSKGMTIIELLIVIVVVGIIATFAVIAFGDTVSNSQIQADSYNLMVLNKATDKYATTVASNQDIFTSISEDDQRVQALITSGFIDRPIVAQQDGATFEWDVDDQSWDLIGGELSDIYFETTVDSYDWTNQTVEEAQGNGTVSINIDKWSTDDGYLENTSGETRLFIPITQSTYTITVSAALGAGNNGGYGIFFDTTLRDGDVDHDDGYVLQIDRGYGEGAMIVRPRINGRERGPVWSVRANSTSIFPSEAEDPDWWIETHTVKIIVTNIDASTRSASFYIDGDLLGTYEYSNAVGDQQIYTGFRGWGGSPTQFYSIDVN